MKESDLRYDPSVGERDTSDELKSLATVLLLADNVFPDIMKYPVQSSHTRTDPDPEPIHDQTHQLLNNQEFRTSQVRLVI